MSEEIKQISRDQAVRMANAAISHTLSIHSEKDYEEKLHYFLEAWGRCEFIEKSELEIAAEAYKKENSSHQFLDCIVNYVDLLKSELEKKNKEIRELKK